MNRAALCSCACCGAAIYSNGERVYIATLSDGRVSNDREEIIADGQDLVGKSYCLPCTPDEYRPDLTEEFVEETRLIKRTPICNCAECGEPVYRIDSDKQRLSGKVICLLCVPDEPWVEPDDEED